MLGHWQHATPHQQEQAGSDSEGDFQVSIYDKRIDGKDDIASSGPTCVLLDFKRMWSNDQGEHTSLKVANIVCAKKMCLMAYSGNTCIPPLAQRRANRPHQTWLVRIENDVGETNEIQKPKSLFVGRSLINAKEEGNHGQLAETKALNTHHLRDPAPFARGNQLVLGEKNQMIPQPVWTTNGQQTLCS